MANIEMKKDKTLGQRITELLDKKGILQRELAERVGITETTMSRYINDKREPKGTVLSKIAEVLGVSSDYLVLWVSDIIQYHTTLYNDINYLYRFVYIVSDVTISYKFVLNLSGQKKKE